MTTDTASSRAATDAALWLAGLDAALARGDIDGALAGFADACFWRDLVSFTWNIKTLEGKAEIAAMLRATLPAVRPSGWRVESASVTDDGTVEAWIAFETALARGVGHLRLKDRRATTLLTTMTELKGFEEKRGPTRETGVVHGAVRNRRTWLERKAEEEAALGTLRQPHVVIIGGGQGGIALGARLKRLGVPAVILEKNRRAGDSWRNRYRSLVLHDPVWYDHLPYIPFPDHWPVFTPKDQLGDWLEMYVKVMGLDYWASSECTGATFDEAAGEWTVSVVRDGAPMTLRPKQLVFATGAYGPPREIPLPGRERFAGTICHSSGYASGETWTGRNAVVIGSNSSAHDIAVDLWEHGAGVTMVQRSPTTVVRSETLMELGFGALYSEAALAKGITTDKADLLFASTPFRLLPEAQRPLYEAIAAVDAAFYARLAAAGFRTDFGADGSGLLMKAFRTGSGYYIDVGGSELIASGEIAVRPGEVREIREGSVVLTDGTEVPADLIVMATGYQTMDVLVARLVSREVADRVGHSWGYGSGFPGDPGPWEGEMRNLWKPTAQPGLWFHGGNLHLSRHYSLYLALQLKARYEGLPTPVYRAKGA
ncbi:MAG TPA: NAD(P)/FAD-dependent oxidoreductase [Bauldia sp.]|nr:NAD(P)/FAD-dependent oxidoreductase [Bauldia sp.]